MAIILMATVVPISTDTAVAATVTGTTIPTVGTSTGMAMGMDVAASLSLSTATAAIRESPSCNGDCHGRGITTDPSTAFLGRKRGAQSGRTSKITVTPVNRHHSCYAA